MMVLVNGVYVYHIYWLQLTLWVSPCWVSPYSPPIGAHPVLQGGEAVVVEGTAECLR